SRCPVPEVGPLRDPPVAAQAGFLKFGLLTLDQRGLALHHLALFAQFGRLHLGKRHKAFVLADDAVQLRPQAGALGRRAGDDGACLLVAVVARRARGLDLDAFLTHGAQAAAEETALPIPRNLQRAQAVADDLAVTAV